MSSSRRGRSEDERRTVVLRLDELAWKAIEQEAAREGLTTEELVAFSVLYYVADVDSGRISRRVSRSPYPQVLSDRNRPVPIDPEVATLSVRSITDRG
jgi:hypothetical protein